MSRFGTRFKGKVEFYADNVSNENEMEFKEHYLAGSLSDFLSRGSLDMRN
jgi:hypothetical protein